METIRTLIVDDEPLARENLRLRLQDVPDFAVVGECGNGRDAVAAITGLHPDLVFLDVRLPDLDGFGVLERVPPEQQPAVVFVTAYDRFALEAFRVHALDYLMKPFDAERFRETLERCRQRVAEQRRPGGGPPADAEGGFVAPDPAAARPRLDRLVIKSRGRVFFLRSDALDWIEACGDYVSLHAGEQSWLLRRTMNEMESRLDPQLFARVSRSAIVRLDAVQDLVPVARGEHVVRLRTGRRTQPTRRPARFVVRSSASAALRRPSAARPATRGAPASMLVPVRDRPGSSRRRPHASSFLLGCPIADARHPGRAPRRVVPRDDHLSRSIQRHRPDRL
jgi:two-component system, LytTR family, response regulator